MSYAEAPKTHAEVSLKDIVAYLGYDRPERSLFDAHQPKTDWFLRPKDAVVGIHGIMHETRVMIWQEILSRLLIQNGTCLDQESLRWAAITHDTQRLDDDYDYFHGERSAVWASRELPLDSSTLLTVMYLNRYHVPADPIAPHMTPELAVFKDADALDRVRKDDLDPSYLRFPVSRNLLVIPAILLCQISTMKYEQQTCPNPYICVMDAAVQMGLVTDR